MRNGSRSEYYLVEGGLKLTRMRQSEWRRRWGTAAVSVFDGQVGASADDGYSSTSGGDPFNATATNSGIGDVGGLAQYDSWALFDPVSIPAGATILNAKLIVIAALSALDGTGVHTLLKFDDIDDAIPPTDRASHVALNRTTASVAWDDVDFVVDVETDSPDITTVIQEVVDRGGWVANQAMQLLWDTNISDSGKIYQPSTYDRDTAKGIQLHVEYSA